MSSQKNDRTLFGAGHMILSLSASSEEVELRGNIAALTVMSNENYAAGAGWSKHGRMR